MKRTPKQLYEYEKSRINGYQDRFEKVLAGLGLNDDTRDELIKLFTWNGNARAIMSKAYQDIKNDQGLIDSFMSRTEGMDIDPLVMDRFFHEGFYESMATPDQNIDRLGIFLREYYGVREG